MYKQFSVFIFLFIPIFSLKAYSQNLTVKGTIVNEERKSLENLNVSIMHENGTIIVHAITDSTGMFLLQIPKGTYVLQIEQFGELFYSENFILKENIDYGEIMLSGLLMLDEIEIEVRKKLIERKVDRLVFNVENLTATTGGDLLDILKITPRIKVQNDQIAMIGKNGMSVMIDGRILQLSGNDLINFLKTISADDIKTIDVITTPPAKYSAEGNSGLINIVRKKSSNDMWNASLRSVYKQATYASTQNSATFNIKREKVMLTSSINYLTGATAPVEKYIIYYPHNTWTEINNRKDHTNSKSANLTFDYNINDRLSTGIVYNITHSKPITYDNNRSLIRNTVSQIVDSVFDTKGQNIKKRISNQFNYHIIYKADTTGKRLLFDYDFFDYINKADRSFRTDKMVNNTQILQTSSVNQGDQKIRNHSANLDIDHHMDWANVNYGAKASFISTANTFRFFDTDGTMLNIDNTKSNAFKYTEGTQSIYGSLQKEIEDKLEIKVGLRLENTQTTGKSVTSDQVNKTSYTKLFPTAYVMYTANDNNSFSVTYGRRINRPTYNLLNPFKWITSPYMYSEGNPFLQPSLSDNIELGYNYKDNLISSLYYTYVNNGFGQVTLLNSETNVQQIIPQNYFRSNLVGINQIVTFDVLKWVKVNLAADVYYSNSSSMIKQVLPYLKGWSSEFSISTDFTLNSGKTLFANVNYWYNTTGISELDKYTPSNQLDVSIKSLLFNKKVTIAAHLNDVFSSNRPSFTTYNNAIQSTFRNYYDNRFFRLSIFYNYGKNIKIARTNVKNQEEFNRVK